MSRRTVVVEVTPATDTPIPTFTPVSQATPSASPTPLATATNTPVPVIAQAVAATTVNVRSGPDTTYPVISSLPPGIALPVIGQNEVGTWWQVRQDDGIPGWVAAFNSADSAHDPPGFYDITVDTRPIPCHWLLTVVYTEDGQTTLATLSDTFEVEVTVDQSIIVANWRKNW